MRIFVLSPFAQNRYTGNDSEGEVFDTMKSKKKKLVSLILFLISIGVCLYPTIGQWHATRQSVLALHKYIEDIGTLPEEYYDEMWQAAEAYNKALKGKAINDPFAKSVDGGLPSGYEDILNIEGMMGYIEIPRIGVSLPIYHGVSEDVLQKGIGHMEGSALPVGGNGGHVLLTGHTGLPNARLFTDLDQLTTGDQFNIRVLNKELVYQVDQIKVVEPDDVSQLLTVEGEDYVTLITCTPYGINSHRLLVRGKYIATLTKQIRLKSYYFKWVFVGGGDKVIFKVLFFVLLGVNLMMTLILMNNRRKNRLCHRHADSKGETGKNYEET